MAVKAAKRQVRRADKHAQALELRRTGMTYAAIGAKLGMTEQGAHQLVQRALAAMVREPGEDVIALERQRLDAALQAIWHKIKRGSDDSIDVMLRIMARRAKLDGLDKGRDDTSVNVSVSGDGPDVTKLSPEELQTHFTLLAKAARSESDRARYQQAADALLPRAPA